MGVSAGPDVIDNGLVLALDAADTNSYPGSGTTWYDLSGKGRDSTIEGATWNASGYFSFDGSGEKDGDPTGNYITLNTSSTTTDPSSKPNGVTYQWWMKIDADQPDGHAILYGSGTINHLEWKGTSTGGNFRTEAVRQNGYSFGGPSVSGGLDSSLWHNISLVFANNESGRPVRWYKNGTLFHTGSMTGGTYPDTEYFVPNAFGRATGVPEFQYSQSFYGRMSQFLVWDKALTASEIQQNFNATRGRFGI